MTRGYTFYMFFLISIAFNFDGFKKPIVKFASNV